MSEKQLFVPVHFRSSAVIPQHAATQFLCVWRLPGVMVTPTIFLYFPPGPWCRGRHNMPPPCASGDTIYIMHAYGTVTSYMSMLARLEQPTKAVWWPWSLTFWPWKWCPQVTRDVGYLCANFSLPRPLCSRLRSDICNRRTSDAHHRLMLPTRRRGHNNCHRRLSGLFVAANFRQMMLKSRKHAWKRLSWWMVGPAAGWQMNVEFKTGFPRLLESPGFFSWKFQDLESPGKSLWSWKVLEIKA